MKNRAPQMSDDHNFGLFGFFCNRFYIVTVFEQIVCVLYYGGHW